MNKAGMNQCQLAKETGLNQSAISHFATGRRTPCLANFRRICIALNVEPGWLIDFKPEEKSETVIKPVIGFENSI